MATTVASLAAVAIVGPATDPTLPQALQTVGMMLTSMPASKLMSRIGRQFGFMVGAAFGMVGACIAAVGIYSGSILLFWVGSLCLGVHNGFAGFYRFAAAEAVGEDRRGRAISYVLAGGILAAFLGPGLAVASRDLVVRASFAGCYLFIAVMATVAALTAGALRLPVMPSPQPSLQGLQRATLLALITRPGYLLSLANATGAYALMTCVMVATPLGMQMCGLSFQNTALVIQFHVLAMYAPSLIVGHAIDRFGARPVMLVSASIMPLSPLLAVSGSELAHFFLALLFLGLAWNLLFTGATRLLTSVIEDDRARGQGLNDFVVFGVTALCSYGSGILLRDIGWQSLNVLVLVVCVALLVLNCWYLTARRKLTQPILVGRAASDMKR